MRGASASSEAFATDAGASKARLLGARGGDLSGGRRGEHRWSNGSTARSSRRRLLRRPVPRVTMVGRPIVRDAARGLFGGGVPGADRGPAAGSRSTHAASSEAYASCLGNGRCVDAPGTVPASSESVRLVPSDVRPPSPRPLRRSASGSVTAAGGVASAGFVRLVPAASGVSKATGCCGHTLEWRRKAGRQVGGCSHHACHVQDRKTSRPAF